jgi:hypothetical protein
MQRVAASSGKRVGTICQKARGKSLRSLRQFLGYTLRFKIFVSRNLETIDELVYGRTE